jgi:hypothetical protein
VKHIKDFNNLFDNVEGDEDKGVIYFNDSTMIEEAVRIFLGDLDMFREYMSGIILEAIYNYEFEYMNKNEFDRSGLIVSKSEEKENVLEVSFIFEYMPDGVETHEEKYGVLLVSIYLESRRMTRYVEVSNDDFDSSDFKDVIIRTLGEFKNNYIDALNVMTIEVFEAFYND